MPLTGTAPALSAALRAALIANSNVHAVDGPALTGLCDAIASVVLAHIIANATVLGTAPPGGGPVVSVVT